jgi:hypothetical protein
MIGFAESDKVLWLRQRLKRVKRHELFFDDLSGTDRFIQRCEITSADIPELMRIVAEDLLDCDPSCFANLQHFPDSDGDATNWHQGFLLATPTNEWIACLVAFRVLIEMKVAEAIPLFVELLFEDWRFPRLPIGIEAERFFALLGAVALQPLSRAYEQSAVEEDDGRRNIVAALGWVAQEHPELKGTVTARLLGWLCRHSGDHVKSNSEIVCVLIDMRVTEARQAIFDALEAGCVDVQVCGAREEIDTDLG